MKNYIRKTLKIQRKSHFQLLELMIAFFILLVCIAPAMRIFTSMVKSQEETIRENQRDHLAHMIHAKFTEMLYKRQIPLGETLQENIIEIQDPVIVDFLKKLSYECSGLFVIKHSHSEDYYAHFTLKMKDKLYKPRLSEKKIENQDPSETVYEYDICIKTPKSNRDGRTQKQSDSPENQNAPKPPKPSFEKPNKLILKDLPK
jgi:hypothetical protein